MTDQVERRKTDANITEVKDVLTSLVGMLTHHMSAEEVQIKEIKDKIDTYFHELDAHTHIFHHNKVAENIKEDEEGHAFWSKVKSSVAEKAIIFVSGIVAMYLVSLIWLDFGNKIAAMPNPPPIVPSYAQPQPSQNVTIQLPPKPNVPNHP